MFDRIIWISGMPRSGTNWLAQIMASNPMVRLKLCPLFSYEFKNAMDLDSSPAQWAEFFTKVYQTPSEYMDQDYLRRDGLAPLFLEREPNPSVLAIKSNRFHHLSRSILEKHPGVTFVGIVRHPCATIHSWLTNPLEFPADCHPRQQWRDGACRKTGPGEFWGFDDWKKVTAMFLDLAQRFPQRFLLVRYESIVFDAQGQIKQLFERLGLGWPAQTRRFLKESQSTHNPHKRAVHKNPAVATRWKTEMDPGMVKTILDELRGTPLECFLGRENQ
ncbi:hypothetical protein Deba_2170 [Desulfarculus baarsii DSM 2075]|uniref:Sulfotransferase n=1 Tax=Desulfarculus baarsii (strain ATCC 33931 / DSM 2075 / LMG 7858 / VKM B-1802 / 2st14) TaxID=644282 RepID=E1QIZ1_DESB2|nr:sulfotransferase [Desulfarculus baarsii]ADK85534.1 hypothetical protein Deba_2170 [Desulfarculus baarsii DSM 2075]